MGWLPLSHEHLTLTYDIFQKLNYTCQILFTLYLLMWRVWWAPNNASKWQMGFNSAFKGLSFLIKNVICRRQMIYHKQFEDAVGIHTFQSQKSHEIAQSPTRIQTKDDNPLTLNIGQPAACTLYHSSSHHLARAYPQNTYTCPQHVL
jgi:hypothetical protein